MGIPGSANPLLFGGAAGYEIEQSLRFNSGDNTVLTRNLTTQGNRTTWTFGGWFKRAETGVTHHLWTAAPGAHASTPYITYLELTDADKLMAYSIDNNVEKFRLRTNQLFRDASAWYHIVMVVDTTLATANDRVKLYVNGEQITSFEQRTNPSQNYETNVNNTIDHTLGEEATRDRYNYNGYMAEVHFVDGTALDATSFGEYDDNGVWRPIEYTGSHGTQGFYLKFDPSATNGIGHDHSGNGNNFTASGFTTSGTGTDVMSDTPTTNWCTWNPLDKNASTSLSDGNLYLTPSASSSSRATFGVSSGLWYYECTVGSVSTNTIIFGYADSLHPTNTYPGTNTTGFGVSYYGYNGSVIINYSSVATLSAATQGDIIGVAVDLTNDKIWFSKNGTWMGTGTQDPNTNQGGIDISSRGTRTILPIAGSGTPAAGASYFNFGQREFAYPSGTSSATEYFNTVTYTGTSAEHAITGVGFQPDLVWIKGRTNSTNHVLVDVARGATKVQESDSDVQEYTDAQSVKSFDADGFTLGTSNDVNNSASGYNSYVAWCWKAGGTASSNTDGDITASVSANQAAGFSVVKYTGTGASNATVGHGLGAVPSLVISKVLSGSTGPWYVKHKDLSSGYNIYLNFTNAQTALTSGGGIGDLSSSTTFTCANGSSNNGNTNSSGRDYITYCFAEKENVSKFGSYTGNGSSNGPDVYCGFKPALVIIKNTSSTGSWYMADTARSSSNPVNDLLFADQSNSEYVNDANGIDVTNNGFKIRNTGSTYNSSGSTYIFMAFAQNFSVDESFKALNSANLPAPDIADGSDYFNTVLYTGTSSTQSITGVGFQPDLAWVKRRDSAANSHALFDAVRGAGERLSSNETTAEVDNTSYFTSFDSDGFSVALDGGETNLSGATYVAWNWKAGGSGSSNTAGSITSTVSANPSAGFSIVSYTGDGNTSSSVTIGHGLGVAPDFIITKMRSSGTDYGWSCWHKDLGGNYGIWLDKTSARNVSMWDGYSSFSDTVFTPPDKDYGNVSGKEYINYCFAEVAGYSKISSWTGNGSTDGPFVYCGFKPAWVLWKSASSTYSWYVVDSTRSTYNVVGATLAPNTANAEDTAWGSDGIFDFTSNGFKVRRPGTGLETNQSGYDYIFAAFASSPFGGDGVSPATAR